MTKIETAAEIPARENIISPCCHDSSDFSPSEEKNKTDYSWLKIGVAIVLAGQGMVFGLGINTADPAPEYASKTYLILHGSLILSALIVFFLLGSDLPREVWKSIRGRQVTVDALFLLSITGAFIGSLISTLRVKVVFTTKW